MMTDHELNICFLKENNEGRGKMKKNNCIRIAICIAVVGAIAVLLCGRYYFSGQYVNPENLTYNLEVSEEELSIAVNSISNQGIQKIAVNESEGVVEISVRCVPKSLFYKTSAESRYAASEKIRQVWIGNRIVWANGETISPLTSKLYDVYNPYIGNMPSNGEIVNALNMTAYTGDFTNEFQTSEEPYTWKMIFQNDFSSDRQDAFEERLKKYAYIYLAQIGNLNEVIYEYSIDGENKTLSVTSSEASQFAGVDIKEVGRDVNQIEALVQKTELSKVVFGGAAVESNAQVDFSNGGNSQEVQGQLYADLFWGNKYQMNLSGNAEEGYYLGQ